MESKNVIEKLKELLKSNCVVGTFEDAEIEILKKIQRECSMHSVCKACNYYDGNAGCLLHSSPTCWELDLLNNDINCGNCLHKCVCYKIGSVPHNYADTCKDFMKKKIGG